MRLYHDSQSPLCRKPTGPAATGEKVLFRLRVSQGVRSALLRFYDGSEKWLPMEREDSEWFSLTVTMPETPLLCWYDFRVEDEDGDIFAYGAPQDGLGGEGVFGMFHAWQITVYDRAYQTPEWLRHGVMYQIFPDRFYSSGESHPRRDECYYHENWDETPIMMPEGRDDNCARDFFGGDLKGIQEKLPYLKDLGVTVIYLNPIFQARSNHRYDTADYSQVDPLLGSNEDFISLCAAAKDMGIRIMLDGVFSHTGEDSVYFNRFGRFPVDGACQSTESPYYPWYKFTQYPDKYRCWWGIHTLPELDKDNPTYQDFMFREDGIVRQWIQRGSSGWRLDVADELTMDFLRKLRKAVKAQDSQAVVLGEVWEDASHKEAYGEMRCYCQGDTLDSVMNYPLRDNAIAFFQGYISAHVLRRLILSQKENYPAPFYYSLMNLAGSHDRPRTINVLCGRTWEEYPPANRGNRYLNDHDYWLGRKRYLELMKLLCALPGIPCVYYGDERGVQGSADPYCRSTFPWNGGDREMEEAVREMLWQRRNSQAMQTGDLAVEAPDDDTLVITREIRDQKDIFGQEAQNDKIVIEIKR